MEQNDAMEQARKDREALEAACLRALADAPMLVRYLRKVAYAASYVPGRTPDQVAWAEGKRALAAQLLTFGGKYDGRSGTELDD